MTAALAGLPGTVLATELGVSVVGDCRDTLPRLPDGSVDLVVTSPPYDRQPKYGDGEAYDRDWYQTTFLEVTAQLRRVLAPHGSLVVNYRSRVDGAERGTLQYELVAWLRGQGWLFAEDFVWAKPNPMPGRHGRRLKDAVEYCFQFARTPAWQFYPDQVLQPTRQAPAARAAHLRQPRRRFPSGHRRNGATANPVLVRPSNVLTWPLWEHHASKHPARFPLALPEFFIRLLTQPGQVVLDPFAGSGTTGRAAEQLGRRWLCVELQPGWALHAMPVAA